jgi:hypothetical protein
MSLRKNRPKCSLTHFSQVLLLNLKCGKNVAQKFGYFCNFQKAAQSKQPAERRKFAPSGVDVMITNFCDFCQFSAKNWRFSQKPIL